MSNEAQLLIEQDTDLENNPLWVFRCSECQYEFHLWGVSEKELKDPPRYCPGCGARFAESEIISHPFGWLFK